MIELTYVQFAFSAFLHGLIACVALDLIRWIYRKLKEPSE